MLYLFDLDGTLISSYLDRPGRVYDQWEVLPSRRERLAELRAAGHTVGIATNQAGVAFGFVTEDQVREKIGRVLEALGLPADTPYTACFGHAQARLPQYRAPEQLACRKPSGHMITEMLERFPEAAAEGTVYVGDRPEDRAAAEDAGVAFVPAEAFFQLSPSADGSA